MWGENKQTKSLNQTLWIQYVVFRVQHAAVVQQFFRLQVVVPNAGRVVLQHSTVLHCVAHHNCDFLPWNDSQCHTVCKQTRSTIHQNWRAMLLMRTVSSKHETQCIGLCWEGNHGMTSSNIPPHKQRPEEQIIFPRSLKRFFSRYWTHVPAIPYSEIIEKY